MSNLINYNLFLSFIFFSLLLLYSKILTTLLLSFKQMYLFEIWHILKITTGANQQINSKKECWLNSYNSFFVYTFSSPTIL